MMIMTGKNRQLTTSLVVISLIFLTGCASLMRPAADRMAEKVASAFLNQNDPATVREAAPAYLIMIDSLISDAPENAELLMTGARLYAIYASAFVEDKARAVRLMDKAMRYAETSICLRSSPLCKTISVPYQEFIVRLEEVDKKQLAATYGFSQVWSGWMQLKSDDWAVVADVPKLIATYEHLLGLQDDYDRGGIHLYLGILHTLLPPAVGGKTQLAREHFETAIAQSQNQNLMIKVRYAKHYARLVFDRGLHDRLLQEVMSADPDIPDLVLTNRLAQEEAKDLLSTAEDYF